MAMSSYVPRIMPPPSSPTLGLQSRHPALQQTDPPILGTSSTHNGGASKADSKRNRAPHGRTVSSSPPLCRAPAQISARSLTHHSVPGISAVPHEDNLRYFDVKIDGPSQSPYEGLPPFRLREVYEGLTK